MLSLPSYSQPITAEPSHNRDELEEVIVTARKRQEKLLDIPIAVTAFSAEQLQQRQIRDVNSLSLFTPGFTLSNYNSRICISNFNY